ncbi:hypothetical protein [Streptomyces broussonetiae]|uniref:LPXTG cell wall anchor domain-containing protein n=1 Tax=Streptomyces broussonetiae TaxID=2686304 RepID=A0A6I6NJQ0_9ACTN|nr:hypothetical protein [Streptomyces broussonetiae]QHA08416.1 hypothetical protein GQF42_38745 [Streptomyces broussonetiae]
MRNRRALAAVCAAFAVLGFAAPVAVADGLGDGNGHRNFGARDPGRGDGAGRGKGNWNGRWDEDEDGRGRGAPWHTLAGPAVAGEARLTVLGGVHSGAGGARSSGATPTDMAIGSALVASAVIGGGVFWLRRRNEKRM